jgi:hypothetical protein
MGSATTDNHASAGSPSRTLGNGLGQVVDLLLQVGFAVGPALRDLGKHMLDLDQGVHHVGRELPAALLKHQLHGLVVWDTGAVDAVAGQGVVGIGNGHDQCGRWDCVTGQAVRITLSVPAFVVAMGDLVRALEQPRRPTRVALDLRDDVATAYHVAAYRVDFFGRQGAGLEQDAIGHGAVADVVQRAGLHQVLQFVIGPQTGVRRCLAQMARQCLHVELDSLDMVTCQAGLGGTGQRQRQRVDQCGWLRACRDSAHAGPIAGIAAVGGRINGTQKNSPRGVAA